MFRLHSNIQLPLFAPVEAPTNTGVASGEMTKDDILDFLNKDDDEKEEIPLADKDDKKTEKKEAKDDKGADEVDEEDKEEDDEESDDESEDSDELDLLEEELEEPDEDKLELTTPISRREILKKYPKLFKEFPQLEKAYYREQEFTKLLPTIDDAKEAVEDSKILANFNRDLSSGNTEVILQAIKNVNPKAYTKAIDNYMAVLNKVDKDAHQHVVGNIIKHTIMAMAEEGRSSSNDTLLEAAQILNQFIFGSSKFTPPSKLSKDDDKSEGDEKEQEISKREREFVRQKFNTASNDLEARVQKAYKNTIEAKIDPKDSMTEYVKKTAVRNALEELETLIEKDSRFKTLVDKLWERAFKDDFSQESLAKIRSAFSSKAQTLLPSIIQKARNEALRGMGKRVRETNEDDDSHQKSESKKGNESRRNRDSRDDESRQRNDSKEKVPAGMSSLEYLMKD